ncbi:MAG: hypothetical protein R2764_21510 [Bacteroidales bacterium]
MKNVIAEILIPKTLASNCKGSGRSKMIKKTVNPPPETIETNAANEERFLSTMPQLQV